MSDYTSTVVPIEVEIWVQRVRVMTTVDDLLITPPTGHVPSYESP